MIFLVVAWDSPEQSDVTNDRDAILRQSKAEIRNPKHEIRNNFEILNPKDVLVAKTIINESVAGEGKELLLEIVSMLIGLIRSNSSSREV